MKYPAQSDLWRLNNAIRPSPIVNQKGQSRVLGRFNQIFPLTLFPDQLIIEELRIIHLQRNGPWSQFVNSIMATDIACVNASAGPFFGHIHIQSLTGGPQIMVDSLHKSDVFKIRSLVEGIALSTREGLRIEGKDLQSEKVNLLNAGSITT